MGNQITDKFVVVDLFSGSYTNERRGHEFFNLKRNYVDNKYYGYCPPTDGLNISRLGASTTETYIDGILVVYVQKKANSSNREIIAFSTNSRVFKTGQPGNGLNRAFEDNDGKLIVCTYSVMSDHMYDLRDSLNKFEIVINDYNNKMFRNQKVYCGKYPLLDEKIRVYINDIVNQEKIDNYDMQEQDEIQRADPADSNEIDSAVDANLNIAEDKQVNIILKNSRVSKKALLDANFTCSIDKNHKTFITSKNLPYMEGHHLIPCTIQNSVFFKEKFDKNIDCYQNIVCLCPNCHREIHFGEWKNKSKKIKFLYLKHKEELKRIGITLTEKELLDLYKM